VILIVDDNTDICDLLARLLGRGGRDVAVAHDGPAALAAMRARVPDLLIVDLMMPGMTGLDVIRATRADPRLSGVPVVLHTADTDPVHERAAARLGARAVVHKPGFERLLDEVRAALAPPPAHAGTHGADAVAWA